MWNPGGGDSPSRDFFNTFIKEEEEEDETVISDSDEEMEELFDEIEDLSVQPLQGGRGDDDDEAALVDCDAEDPIAPPYSPLSPRRTSPQPSTSFQSAEARRSRSRSPIRRTTSYPSSPSQTPLRAPETYQDGGIIVQLVNEDGSEVIEGDFFIPDAHVVYETYERTEMDEMRDLRLDNVTGGIIVERGAVQRRSERARRANVRGRGRRGRPLGGRGRPLGGRGGGCSRRSGWQPGQPLTEIWPRDENVPEEYRQRERDVMRRQQVREEGRLQRRSTRARGVSIEGRNNGKESESIAEDVFFDATVGRMGLEGEDLHFEWSPMETFRGKEETFIPEQTGPTSSYSSPYDAFRSYWDESILQTIVDETNRYAAQISSKSASFRSEWYNTNVHELLCLFAFWMMTGIIRMPTISSYFSTHSILHHPAFSKITTKKRYNNLNRAVNFADTSSKRCDAASSDRMHRLRPIIDYLNLKFQTNYIPSRDICIDESLLLWKGRLKFKQYIRTKAAKFGIKTFELCESATGYLWSFLVYTGKETMDTTSIPKSTTIVLNLINPLLNKGYRLFMDNWFNSPLLSRFLKRNGTDSVGTLRPCREDVPKVVTYAPLSQGQLIARHSGDVCVLAWQDKKRVTMISTYHNNFTALPAVSSHPNPMRPDLFKPQCILDYNRSMGGVDLKDQMLEPYLLERKRCSKWYVKLFKRLLNASIQNSRILLESSLPEARRLDSFKFRVALVQSILDHHHHLIPEHRQYQQRHSTSSIVKVNNVHWPTRVAQSAVDISKNRHSRQKCVVCLREGRKTQKTCYMCEACKVPLCVEPCFKKYHS